MSLSLARSTLITMLKASTTLTVYADGENFTPRSTSDYPFARFTFMPVETIKRSIGNGGTKELSGLAQVDLYYTRSINSSTDAFTQADTIVTAFTPQTVILADGRLIIEMAWYEVAKQEASAIGLPVYIRWTLYQS